MTDGTAYGAMVMRLALGAMALGHGLMKIFDFGFAGTAGFFASLGLPGILAYAVILVEVVGGVMLILGVLTRWVALVLAVILVGAIVFVHLADGLWEYPLFLLASSVAVALLGSGAHALEGRRQA